MFLPSSGAGAGSPSLWLTAALEGGRVVGVTWRRRRIQASQPVLLTCAVTWARLSLTFTDILENRFSKHIFFPFNL